MPRYHRYTLKRIDPWSVLKFAAIVSVVLFLVLTLTVAFAWYILNSFDLINRGCDVALDVGFANCDISAGVVFRATALVAGLIAVVHTAVLVFGAFLFNLIGELTGGIGMHMELDDMTTEPAQKKEPSTKPTTTVDAPASGSPANPTTPTNRPANPVKDTPRNELFE